MEIFSPLGTGEIAQLLRAHTTLYFVVYLFGLGGFETGILCVALSVLELDL